MSPLYAGFSATNGLRACTREHAVENIAADGNLRLLGTKQRARRRRPICPL